MKSLILATAAILAIGTGSAFAAGTMQAPHRTNAPQGTMQAQNTNANSGGTVIYSGTSNQLYPAPQGG